MSLDLLHLEIEYDELVAEENNNNNNNTDNNAVKIYS